MPIAPESAQASYQIAKVLLATSNNPEIVMNAVKFLVTNFMVFLEAVTPYSVSKNVYATAPAKYRSPVSNIVSI